MWKTEPNTTTHASEPGCRLRASLAVDTIATASLCALSMLELSPFDSYWLSWVSIGYFFLPTTFFVGRMIRRSQLDHLPLLLFISTLVCFLAIFSNPWLATIGIVAMLQIIIDMVITRRSPGLE